MHNMRHGEALIFECFVHCFVGLYAGLARERRAHSDGNEKSVHTHKTNSGSTYLPTHPLSYPPTHLLKHPLIHPINQLTHSLTHSLAHSLAWFCMADSLLPSDCLSPSLWFVRAISVRTTDELKTVIHCWPGQLAGQHCARPSRGHA